MANEKNGWVRFCDLLPDESVEMVFIYKYGCRGLTENRGITWKTREKSDAWWSGVPLFTRPELVTISDIDDNAFTNWWNSVLWKSDSLGINQEWADVPMSVVHKAWNAGLSYGRDRATQQLVNQEVSQQNKS